MILNILKWIIKITEAIFYDIEVNLIQISTFIYFKGKEGAFQLINSNWLIRYCFINLLDIAFERSCSHWNVID